MEFVLEFLFTVFVEILFWGVIAFPGALILWLSNKKGRTLMEVINRRLYSSIFIGVFFWVTLILVITLI